jgi:hypothetical protein
MRDHRHDAFVVVEGGVPVEAAATPAEAGWIPTPAR